MGTIGFPLLGEKRGVHLSRVDWGREKMESPPRFGLGTIYIARVPGKTDFTTRVWVWTLGMIWGRC